MGARIKVLHLRDATRDKRCDAMRPCVLQIGLHIGITSSANKHLLWYSMHALRLCMHGCRTLFGLEDIH